MSRTDREPPPQQGMFSVPTSFFEQPVTKAPRPMHDPTACTELACDACYVVTLKAENERLRLQLQASETSLEWHFHARAEAEEEALRLQATVARVEALPALWESRPNWYRLMRDCAASVRAALADPAGPDHA